MFKKESEVYKTMSGGTQESDHESVESIEEQKQNVADYDKQDSRSIQEMMSPSPYYHCLKHLND
jgi:hypothetical protein